MTFLLDTNLAEPTSSLDVPAVLNGFVIVDDVFGFCPVSLHCSSMCQTSLGPVTLLAVLVC